jgi:phage shock protein C
MQVNRRLYRCRHDRRLAGVAAGVAEFFDLDPTLVRVVWFLSIFAGGFGIFLYIALAIIVPLEPVSEGEAAAGDATTPEGHRHVRRGDGRLSMIVGIALIFFGSLALIELAMPGWVQSARALWPLVLVGIGGLLVVGAFRRQPTES